MTQFPKALLLSIRLIDAITAWSGERVRWLIIPLVGVLSYEVFARYLFNAPTVWAFEITYMLYGSHFMLGAAYALYEGAHIRTDIFYSRFPVRWQGVIDAALYVFLFFPGILLFLVVGWEEAVESWRILERSDASTWRPPLYPLKTVIPVAALLLLIQAVSEFLKSLYAVARGERL